MSNPRIEQLNGFLKESPDDSFVLYALATEYINEGNDYRGLEYFQKLLIIDPDYTGMYYHLGKLYQRQQQKSLAEMAFHEGLKRTVDKDPHAYRELKEALNQLEDGDEED